MPETASENAIGSPSTTDVPDTPNLDGHVNDAYQEIFNKYKFKRRRGRARFSTIIGAGKYDTSTLTNVIYKVWDRTNGRELTKIGTNVLAEKDYDNSASLSVQNARPQQYAFTETYIQLIPVPDGVYSIELVYKLLFSALIGDTAVPVIPSEWHRGVVILASHMYYDDEGADPVKATYHSQRFKDWVSDQPVEEHEETEAIDSGVEVPTLAAQRPSMRRPDGVWWDILP